MGMDVFVTPILQPASSAIRIYYEPPAGVESLSQTILVVTDVTDIAHGIESVSSVVLVQTSIYDIAGNQERLTQTVLVQTSESDFLKHVESLSEVIDVETTLTDGLVFSDSIGTTVLVLTSIMEWDERLSIVILVETSNTELQQRSGVECFDLLNPQSAWTTEGILTKGYEARSTAFPNWGPGADQELVTKGFSYPRGHSGFHTATLGLYGYMDWLYDRMTRLFDGLRGLSDSSLPAYITALNSITWLNENPKPTERYWALEVYSDNLMRHLNGGPPQIRGTVNEPFVFTSSNNKLKITATLEGVLQPTETITIDPGTYSAHQLSAFVNLSATTFQLKTNRSKVSIINLPNTHGPDNSLKLESVANSCYATLGILENTYAGLDLLEFDDLCQEVFMNIDSLLQGYEGVRTVELGY